MPLHDPIKFDLVAELIKKAVPSLHSAVLHDAWRKYAFTAVRPYAWKTFAQYARQHFMETGDRSLGRGKEAHALAGRRSRLATCSRSRRVCGFACPRRSSRNRAWTARQSADDPNLIDAEPKPRAILFDSHGEFMTGEALRRCARYSIDLALPGGPGRLITMIESALETQDEHRRRACATSMLSIIRAQCAADR